MVMLASFFPYSETWISWKLFWAAALLLGVLVLVPWPARYVFYRRSKSPPRALRRIIACALGVVCMAFVASTGILVPVYAQKAARDSIVVASALFAAFLGATSLVGAVFAWAILYLPREMSFRYAIRFWPAFLVLVLVAVGLPCLERYSHDRLEDAYVLNGDVVKIEMIAAGLKRYHKAYNAYPPSLSELVKAGYLDEWHLRGYSGCRSFHYLNLPENARGDLVWVWLEVPLNRSNPGLILYRSGTIAQVKAAGLADQLGQARRWLTGHRGTGMPETAPATTQSARPG